MTRTIQHLPSPHKHCSTRSAASPTPHVYRALAVRASSDPSDTVVCESVYRPLTHAVVQRAALQASRRLVSCVACDGHLERTMDSREQSTGLSCGRTLGIPGGMRLDIPGDWSSQGTGHSRRLVIPGDWSLEVTQTDDTTSPLFV